MACVIQPALDTSQNQNAASAIILSEQLLFIGFTEQTVFTLEILSNIIFIRFKLCLATATYNFRWVSII